MALLLTRNGKVRISRLEGVGNQLSSSVPCLRCLLDIATEMSSRQLNTSLEFQGERSGLRQQIW